MTGLAAFTAAAAVGAGSLAVADDAPATDGYRLPDDAPQPGAGFRIGAVYQVSDGTLSYTCTDGAWSAAPVPDATLRSPDGTSTVRHTDGPQWTSMRDGSTIVASPAPASRGTGPGGLPWLLLNVSEHRDVVADGELAAVAYVSVLNTSGGAVPDPPCVPGFDTVRAVRYSADYVFWTPTNPGR
jgi:hypothetical protein